MDKYSWIMRPNHAGYGRGVCAAVGVAIAAALHYFGFTPAEPTMLSGIAYAAAGAAIGLLVYGIFDIIRKVL